MQYTDKSTRILALYYQLITGQVVRKQTFCVEYNITERTFDRDVEDIRMFLSDEQPYCELLYSREDNSYYLTHVVGKTLSAENALYLTDILFSMRNASKDETEGILTEIIEATELHKSNEVLDYARQQMKRRNSWNGKAVLKMHWDLQQAIKCHNQIEMSY